MKPTDLVRAVLDLIDQLDSGPDVQITVGSSEEEPNVINDPNEELRRFQQILDLLNGNNNLPYGNSPDEAVAGIDSVTTNAGGGVNGPKNPRDIRGNSFPVYPEE